MEAAPVKDKGKAAVVIRLPTAGPSNANTNGLVMSDEIVHNVLCEKCHVHLEECRGLPGRTCKVCTRLKTPCNKSMGRGGKAKTVEVEEKVKESKLGV